MQAGLGSVTAAKRQPHTPFVPSASVSKLSLMLSSCTTKSEDMLSMAFSWASSACLASMLAMLVVACLGAEMPCVEATKAADSLPCGKLSVVAEAMT